MIKLVQLSTSHNQGAIGKIMEQIGIKARDEMGFDSWVIYGRHTCTSELKCIKMGNVVEVVEHYLEDRVLDNEGLSSRCMTQQIVRKLKELKPDIIHLHNIHDHWLNYPILFEYLNSSEVKVVWTFHDCWAYTGHCFHFITVGCDKWKNQCGNCIQKGRFFDKSDRNYKLKKKTFLGNGKLHITTVSKWLFDVTSESFYKNCDIRAIPNGLDIDVFKQVSDAENIWNLPLDKKIVMGVATSWGKDKGIEDFYKLAKLLGSEYQIVLVGLTEKQAADAPSNIIGLPKTRNQKELCWLYNLADVVVSMSKAETFGLTIAEGMACGTPAVVYNNTALPELISEDTGIVVTNGNVAAFKEAIITVCRRGKKCYSAACRNRAEERFDKNKCYEKYMDLYKEIIREG